MPCWVENFTADGVPLAPCGFADVALVENVSMPISWTAPLETRQWRPSDSAREPNRVVAAATSTVRGPKRRCLAITRAQAGLRTSCFPHRSDRDGQAAITPGAIEVFRGPLTLALRPETAVNETNIYGTIKRREVMLEEDATWNYALDVASFEVSLHDVPSPPFAADLPPAVSVTARARVVDAWTTAGGARGVAFPPASPLDAPGPDVDVTLVPYGATNLRISVFPQLGASAAARLRSPP